MTNEQFKDLLLELRYGKEKDQEEAFETLTNYAKTAIAVMQIHTVAEIIAIRKKANENEKTND